MTHSEPAREAVAAGRRRDISSPERSFWETPRQIAHVEADEAATRLINSHFKNDAERARVSIPANPERDDDLIIRSYIRQQARLSASPAPAAGVEAVREALAEELRQFVGNYWRIKTAAATNPFFMHEHHARLIERTIAALASPAATSGPTYVVNCCNCGRIIDTREESEGGDQWGHELSDDRWACSPECLDAVTDPVTPAGRLALEKTDDR